MATYMDGMTEHEKERLRNSQRHDRRIRNQKCETCGAEPGWMCFTRSGFLSSRYHVTRTTAASRKEREERSKIPGASQAVQPESEGPETEPDV